MGYVRVKGRVSNIMDSSKSVEIEFIADTGAMWTVLPKSKLQALGIQPIGERTFKLVDGEARRFPVGDARIEIEGLAVMTTLVFGSEDAPALLGVTTLEQLGLEVDPVTGKLKPMELMLL
jgi:clan AA aspartic protease